MFTHGGLCIGTPRLYEQILFRQEFEQFIPAKFDVLLLQFWLYLMVQLFATQPGQSFSFLLHQLQCRLCYQPLLLLYATVFVIILTAVA